MRHIYTTIYIYIYVYIPHRNIDISRAKSRVGFAKTTSVSLGSWRLNETIALRFGELLLACSKVIQIILNLLLRTGRTGLPGVGNEPVLGIPEERTPEDGWFIGGHSRYTKGPLEWPPCREYGLGLAKASILNSPV